MKAIGIIIAILIIGVVAWLVIGNSNEEATNTNTTTNTTANTTTNSASNVNIFYTDPTGESMRVYTDSSGFDPETARIGIGDAVSWYNKDEVQHYIAPDDHPDHVKYSGIWDDDGSGNIAPAEVYSVIFFEAGTYEYHDHLNPDLTGTVVVE
ncbi:hypothetical protein ACFL0L_02565 [Patescibacteria group bacterium]